MIHFVLILLLYVSSQPQRRRGAGGLFLVLTRSSYIVKESIGRGCILDRFVVGQEKKVQD